MTRIETVIIGAGQAGLSTAYHLTRLGRSCVVLEGKDRVGDTWRERFDSLRLYTPARVDTLPGLPFPAPPWSYPTRDQMADYLETYAAHFQLPVRTGHRVEEATRNGHGYVVMAGGHRFVADNVVVASGNYQRPRVPDFAPQLNPEIRQLHSGEYRNPSQLQDGAVLVVGASHSGADIAFEVARSHRTILCGKDRGQFPFRIEHPLRRVVVPIMFFLAKHLLTMRTPIGRAIRPEIRAHGGPLIRHKRSDLAAAGVERTEARVVGVRDGRPLLDDGTVVDVANVIWCTGFHHDNPWLRISVLGEDGWPAQDRGVAAGAPGLYFVGLEFQYSFSSMLVGGAGRDAHYVARHIAGRAGSAARGGHVPPELYDAHA
jgi:putative flavoprotein involved in K+ transport